jgi:hypothetical protein
MPQIAVKGIYRNGVVVPSEAIPCKDETPVFIVLLEEPASEEAKKVEMFLSNLTPSTLVPKNLIGCAKSGKGDISSNKYKYLGEIK